jgi:hypothetical protein
MSGPLDYDGIKQLATDFGRSMGTLIALTDDNDPFLADRPGRRMDGALWFAELWSRLGIEDGVHVRRLHCRLISTTGITTQDGDVYENTHKNWRLICAASADARYFDLVPAGAFVDRRPQSPSSTCPTTARRTPSPPSTRSSRRSPKGGLSLV